MDVCIVASGQSSRLVNYTKDYLPKYLLNIDNYPALVKIVQYWGKYANRIFLVIHEKFDIITQFIISHFLKSYQIHIIHYNQYDGTAFTIKSVYEKHLIKQNVKNLLITWSDILPKEDLNMHYFQYKKKQKNYITIFTYGKDCRYEWSEEHKIQPSSSGNIIGIYYIQHCDFQFRKEIEKNIDIVEYLPYLESNTMQNYELKDVLDFGDEQKYKTIIESQNDIEKLNCRSFNEIYVKQNQLCKRAIHEKGKQVIQHEIQFYKFLSKQEPHIQQLFPKVYEYYESAYSMEYKKDYDNLYKFLKRNTQKKNEFIISQVLEQLQLLHKSSIKTIPRAQFLHNMKGEMYDKIIQRIQVIQPILDYFPKFKKVNSLYIEDFNTLLNKIHQFIFTYYELLEEFTYSVIHGDPNFSNILINPDNHETCFIDPRGYFSSSEIYGSIDYDYAKILYGLSGYDEFNNHHFVIDYLDEKEIKFKIEEIDVSNAFKEERFTTIHKMMVVIIWLGLAEYNKNNIWKCVASYYHGLYLGSQIHL